MPSIGSSTLLGTSSEAMSTHTSPRCPTCGMVMRDDPRGFVCGGCRRAHDWVAELDAVQIRPEFDGPEIQGG